MKPNDWSSGVDGTLATRNPPLSGSSASRSVNVPPTSTPICHPLRVLLAAAGPPGPPITGPLCDGYSAGASMVSQHARQHASQDAASSLQILVRERRRLLQIHA